MTCRHQLQLLCSVLTRLGFVFGLWNKALKPHQWSLFLKTPYREQLPPSAWIRGSSSHICTVLWANTSLLLLRLQVSETLWILSTKLLTALLRAADCTDLAGPVLQFPELWTLRWRHICVGWPADGTQCFSKPWWGLVCKRNHFVHANHIHHTDNFIFIKHSINHAVFSKSMWTKHQHLLVH